MGIKKKQTNKLEQFESLQVCCVISVLTSLRIINFPVN